MIATIEHLKQTYIRGISTALNAYKNLSLTDPAFRELQNVPTVAAIDEMNATANRVIENLARAQHEMKKPGTTINVGGDMIQVGDITDSDNITVGKDIDTGVKKNA